MNRTKTFGNNDTVNSESSNSFSPAEEMKVVLPGIRRNERKFSTDIGKIIGPLNVAFLHNDRVVEIQDEPVPIKPEDELDRNQLARGGQKFRPLTGVRVKGWIEKYLTTGKRIRGKFAEKTMSVVQARSLIENPFFISQLPKISRIAPVPLPILMRDGDIRMLRPGFNKELEIYCPLNSPPIQPLDIDQAREVLNFAHLGFEFKNAQSRTHAIARLLTPFFKGVIGFSEPLPCWYFNANRPRCGKDYLAGITQITYEGFAFEDAALGDDPEETRKRITAGLLAGRRFFHFANCQGYLADKYFIQAITDRVWRDRLLGSNDAASDLQIINESEYSVSANQGLTYREDVEPRLRKIDLVFYEEDANSRVFPVEDLHGWAIDHRPLVLSAVYSVFKYWFERGMPNSHPFASFKRWGKIIGGAMVLTELGDPTQPHEDESLLSGDLQTEAMKALYGLAYEHFPEEWVPKKEIYAIVAANRAEDDRLAWFGDLSGDNKKSGQSRIGKTIAHFNGRILGGIRLAIDDSTKKTQRWQLRFTKISIDRNGS
jgi:hypothetical protein